MKDRGKATAMETKISDFNYSVSSDMPCMKHPNSSPIGICSFCLKDKLLNLIYSDRSSCSVEVGSVGRISLLLENEKQSKTEQVILLRSSSNRVEIKKNRNGFWKIKRLFKKNREKGDEKSEVSGGGGKVSRSRSLCSFRGGGGGGGGGGGDDGSSDYRFSSAKISDVTGGLLFDYADHVVEARKSESGGDFKNLRKKFANSESLCCSDSPNMLPILKKRASFRGSDTYVSTFLKSPTNINSDRGTFFPDFGNTMDDDGDFKNLRKKIPNSESFCCSDSPNMLPILQKRTTLRGCNAHSATFLKSTGNVNTDKGSDFGNTMDDDGDFKNLRKIIPNSESLCCSDSPNMLPILQKSTSLRPISFLKSPSNVNSDRGMFFPVKESDFGNTMNDDDSDFKNLRKKFPNSDSLGCSDSPNILPPHSYQILQKRTTSHSTLFLKSPSNNVNTMDDDDDDSAFIDLKLDLLSSSRTSLSEPKLQLFSESANLRSGSCRMNAYDTRMKEGNSGKGNKVWKWISRKKITTTKRDEINSNLIIKY